MVRDRFLRLVGHRQADLFDVPGGLRPWGLCQPLGDRRVTTPRPDLFYNPNGSMPEETTLLITTPTVGDASPEEVMFPEGTWVLRFLFGVEREPWSGCISKALAYDDT